MKIKKIEKIDYNGDVYNLHVKDNHNYFANGLLVHNCHRFSSDVTSELVSYAKNTKYRFGFTGTLPEDPVALYRLYGLFGQPTRFIRSRELIDRGLGTPININVLILNYNDEIKKIIKGCSNWTQQLKVIKEYEPRNNLIINLSKKLFNKAENTLVLFSHTEHGKTLFNLIMNKIFPDVKIENKNITGKKSFDFQKQFGIYFINGEDDAKTRELTRKILEEIYVEFDLDNTHYRMLKQEFEESFSNLEIKNYKQCGAILISNYAILSTGVNIKQLHNMIFASPLKAYTTITQSIGRGMRLHESKSVFNVFDIVDNLGIRKPSGVFYKQYQHRLATSYNPEGYRIKEVFMSI